MAGAALRGAAPVGCAPAPAPAPVRAPASRMHPWARAPLAPQLGRSPHPSTPPPARPYFHPAVFQAGWASVPAEWRALPEAEARLWRGVAAIRSELNLLLEKARGDKALGASLEAKVSGPPARLPAWQSGGCQGAAASASESVHLSQAAGRAPGRPARTTHTPPTRTPPRAHPPPTRPCPPGGGARQRPAAGGGAGGPAGGEQRHGPAALRLHRQPGGGVREAERERLLAWGSRGSCPTARACLHCASHPCAVGPPTHPNPNPNPTGGAGGQRRGGGRGRGLQRHRRAGGGAGLRHAGRVARRRPQVQPLLELQVWVGAWRLGAWVQAGQQHLHPLPSDTHAALHPPAAHTWAPTPSTPSSASAAPRWCGSWALCRRRPRPPTRSWRRRRQPRSEAAGERCAPCGFLLSCVPLLPTAPCIAAAIHHLLLFLSFCSSMRLACSPRQPRPAGRSAAAAAGDDGMVHAGIGYVLIPIPAL